MTGKPLPSGIRFSPTIELGHVLQALVMFAMFSGWALYGFNTIQQQLNQQSAQMELFKQRMTIYETGVGDLRDSLKTVTRDTQTLFAKISDQIADLRADLSGVIGNGKGAAGARR